MSTIKISQLNNLPSIAANTSNTLFLGVDIPSGITGKFTATTLSQQLYANNYLRVGNYGDVYPNTIGTFAGASNNYVQNIIENTGDYGSSDIVAQANVSTDVANYIDMGFAGSKYNNTSPYNSLGTSLNPLDGYLYVQGDGSSKGGNLIIGTTSTGKHISFISGGSNTQNIVVTIDATGIHSASIDANVAYGAGVDATQNTQISGIQGVDLTQNSSISIIQGVDLTQNSNISIIQGVDITQNTRLNAIETINTNQNTSISIIQSIDNSQNTNIGLAWNLANTALQNTSTITTSANLVVPNILTAGNTTINNGITINGTGIYQYSTANNSTVTQATSKSTSVYANGRTGQITTSNSALINAQGTASFYVYNTSVVSAKDTIIVNQASGPVTYQSCVSNVAPGQFAITITNVQGGGGSSSDVLVLNYAILRVN